MLAFSVQTKQIRVGRFSTLSVPKTPTPHWSNYWIAYWRQWKADRWSHPKHLLLLVRSQTGRFSWGAWACLELVSVELDWTLYLVPRTKLWPPRIQAERLGIRELSTSGTSRRLLGTPAVSCRVKACRLFLETVCFEILHRNNHPLVPGANFIIGTS